MIARFKGWLGGLVKAGLLGSALVLGIGGSAATPARAADYYISYHYEWRWVREAYTVRVIWYDEYGYRHVSYETRYRWVKRLVKVYDY